jgi:hypothetical protein
MLARIVTGDEFTLTSPRQSVHQCSGNILRRLPPPPPQKKIKVTPSSRKVVLTVFWDHEGMLLTAFQPQGQTVNADSYFILRNFVRPFNGSDQYSPGQGSHRLVPTAAQRILCCWFSGACETIGQVPQCTGRLYLEIKVFFKSVLFFV